MQDAVSLLEVPARHRTWVAAALGAAFACSCATGVDVTDEELDEICAEQGIDCGSGGPSAGGSSVGVAGSGGTGINGGQSGSFNSGAGTGGTFSGTSGSNTGGSAPAAGGTGTGVAGTGGTGASQPAAPGECVEGDISILYRDRKLGVAATNEPSMVLSLQNAGAAFDVTALTIRYWFTADGTSNFTGNVDYATLGGGGNLQVTVSFGQEFGSDYAELGFSGGMVTTGIQEVQLRFHSTPYSDLTQTNDFSFIAPATNAVPNPNITAYLNGTQVSGCVPVP